MDKKDNKQFDFKELIYPYLYQWKLFAGIIFVTTLIAIYYIKSTAPIYKIQSSILIKDANKMSTASGDFGVLQSIGAFPNMGTNSIENELEVFKSKTIIEDVLKQHNFQISQFSKQQFYDLEIYGKNSPFTFTVVSEKDDLENTSGPIFIKSKNGNLSLIFEDKEYIAGFDRMVKLPFASIIISKNKKYKQQKNVKMNDIYFSYTPFQDAVINFQRSLLVDLLDKDATVIGLSVNFPNKEKGIDFLNTLIRQYNIYAVEDKSFESKKTKDFIDERIVLISKELGDVETEKQEFKSNKNIVDLGTEARMNLQLKQESRARAMDVETQIELSDILQDFLRKQNYSETLPLNIGLNNETASKSIQDYNLLVIKRNSLLENATADNPVVKQIEKELISIKSALSESLKKNRTSLELAKGKILSEMDLSEGKISQIPFQEKLFRNIERQQQIKENLYLLLLQKREEAAITMAITAEKARIVDKAFANDKKVAPKKMYALVFALAGGFLLTFTIVYLRILLNDKIITRKDIESLVSRPVISEIPHIVNKKSEIVKLNDITPIAEAFRILVTNLKFIIPKTEAAPVIMVTSSVKGEGKTLISVNFALVLASTLKKVVVIGGDIRNPQLQRYHSDKRNAKGLTEYLYGEIENIEQIIHKSGFNDNCDFIYSGSIPPNPVDLMQSTKYSDLLNYLKSKYDYIVIDTAPLLLVTDTFLIAEHADATIYVVRSEVSKKDFMAFAENQINQNTIKNTAFVLNDVRKVNLGYSNQYGYGYQVDKKKWWDILKWS